MSPIVVPAEELLGAASQTTRDDGALLVFFDDAIRLPAEIRKLWVAVLLMALRDRATSVHYHPWRSDGRLTYVLEGFQRYELIPPPDEHADAVIEAARSLFAAPPAGGLLSRLVGSGSERAVCSTFVLGGWNGALTSVLWDAVVWSNGEWSGVELIRVTPLEPDSGERQRPNWRGVVESAPVTPPEPHRA